MNFIQFARAHGILIDYLPPVGVWKRFPTDDHPRSRNGAVKFMGNVGFVQNWALNEAVNVWKDDGAVVDTREMDRLARAERQKRDRLQKEAASKATWILNQCQLGRHEYLKRKGFPEELGYIWVNEGNKILCIPMRVGGHLVGVQMIKEDGEKKFLYGQKTSHAQFVFDNKGIDVLCEGYATALSVRAVLKQLKRRYTLHVCFSANNMEKVASTLQRGFVIADNDLSETGERTAKKIGWAYYMPPAGDFNDFFVDQGLFRSTQIIAKSMPMF
jgi:phage/plasmid primase-like uncharacterized protein